jgi:hypothetical protein
LYRHADPGRHERHWPRASWPSSRDAPERRLRRNRGTASLVAPVPSRLTLPGLEEARERGYLQESMIAGGLRILPRRCSITTAFRSAPSAS